MDTQNPTSLSLESSPETLSSTHAEFQPGDFVAYGLHGKCTVTAIETRVIGGESIRFYRLEVFKAIPSRPSKREPAIWVPVNSSKECGLRSLMNAADVAATYVIFADRECYFSLNDHWSSVHPKLDASIRTEGCLGLAKVLSYLSTLKRRQVVPTAEVTKLYDQVMRILVRETAEIQAKLPRTIEDEITKLLRNKLLTDN